MTPRAWYLWIIRNRAALGTVAGYATFTVITVTVFVYLTFPWQTLSEWIRVQIARSVEAEISVKQSRFRFPFRMDWDGVIVTAPGRPDQAYFRADHVSVGWPVGSILARKMDLDVSVGSLGGRLIGRLKTRRVDSGRSYHFKGSAAGFDLAQIARGWELPVEGMSGTLRITRVEHEWVNSDWAQGQGSLSLEVQDAAERSLEISFNRISGLISAKGGMANLENFSAQGPALELVGSGSLLLRPVWKESLLNFNARVTLRKPTGPLSNLTAMASPDGRLDFSLRGPLLRPTPYVNGTALAPLPAGGGSFTGAGRRGVS